MTRDTLTWELDVFDSRANFINSPFWYNIDVLFFVVLYRHTHTSNYNTWSMSTQVSLAYIMSSTHHTWERECFRLCRQRRQTCLESLEASLCRCAQLSFHGCDSMQSPQATIELHKCKAAKIEALIAKCLLWVQVSQSYKVVQDKLYIVHCTR